MTKRKVTASDFIQLLKNRKPYSVLGIAFVFLSLFFLLPMTFMGMDAFTEPYQKYDFSKIEKNGIEETGTITGLNPVYNVTINGEHPMEISYVYIIDSVPKSDMFQTMDLHKTAQMKVGDRIPIKAFENQSMIQDLEPFKFPFYLFYILPFVFLALGIPFFFIGVVPALREYNLYKNGIVQEATIISLVMNSGSPIFNVGQGTLIHYYFFGSNGQRIFGRSKTTDFTMLEKKTDDKIKIFVSESDETKSCMVPKLEALKNNWEI